MSRPSNRRFCNGSGLIPIYNMMTMRHLLLAACALALPASAPPGPGPAGAPPPMQMPAPRAEPWMAPPPGPAPQPWGLQHAPGRTGGRTSGTRGALESVELPPAIEQGVDMIYIDEDLVPKAVQSPSLLQNVSFDQ